jgi:UDP-N-acetylmuramate--alanine ligase
VQLDKIHTVYFVGIGGIGMSALARYFNAKGKAVSGYDRKPTPLTKALQAEGIAVHFEDDIQQIPASVIDMSQKEGVLAVYTPAIPHEHKELNHLIELGHPLYKRSEVLGMITRETYTIAVAGTHGKTTTSTIIAHVLKESGVESNAFLGGIASNYNTNALISEESNSTVVEADEYDRSFLTLYPNIAVVTSMDADHLDIYGDKSHLDESFAMFLSQVKPGGMIVAKFGLEVRESDDVTCITYSLDNEAATVNAQNIRIVDGTYIFDVRTPLSTLSNVQLGLAGLHNVENALAAIAVAQQLEIADDIIISCLASFRGVKRRFEYQLKSQELVYIDDYAHHPEELRATISSVREMYPGKKITGIFQPHLFTRTRDFADEFARSLELLNELVLLEIYPARELPLEGINSQFLLDKVNLEHKVIRSKKELIDDLKTRKLEVLLTLGAGDIDQLVEPIRNEFLNRSGKEN